MRFLKKLIMMSFLFVACSPHVPEMRILSAPKNVTEDKVAGNLESKVDILFVIDDSGSMQPHQRNLSDNIKKFADQFTKNKFLDFHIGVISTTNSEYYQRCCGRLIGFPTYFEQSTPDLVDQLSYRMMLGINGSGEEMGFDPVYQALSQPNLSNANKGFYREEAYLVIVFITDAEDQSDRMNESDLYKFLIELKKTRDKVLGYGVIIPSDDMMNCPRDDGSTPVSYEKFLGMLVNGGSNIMNLCTPDFGKKLAEMGSDIVKRMSIVFYLSRRPVPDTIKIMYGTQEILSHPENPKKGWYYDSEINAVILGEEIEWSKQPPGTKVQIFYDAAVTK